MSATFSVMSRRTANEALLPVGEWDALRVSDKVNALIRDGGSVTVLPSGLVVDVRRHGESWHFTSTHRCA